ncbi:MAG: hypothetical protein LKK08_06210 [Bacteroidales bacterium]|jgi:hypothetical protein|nr:hypothetical protein [Bacteroidales bacterium]
MGITAMLERTYEMARNRKSISELTCRNKTLAEPVLTDMSKIPELWKLFQEILAERGNGEKIKGTYDRDKFLLIVVLLYSPATLSGEKMGKGLRDVLAECFGLNAPSAISDNVRDVIFLWENYSSFRDDVKYIWSEIKKRQVSAF